MSSSSTLAELFRYGHATNLRLLESASALTDAQLDQPIDIGLGSIRRLLRHILAGESVWLSRSKGNVETPWPNESLALSIAQLKDEFAKVHREWDTFLAHIPTDQFDRLQSYRDSKGSVFRATLREMLIQAVLHSHHHRAQVSYALKHVAGVQVDLDYMYATRKSP